VKISEDFLHSMKNAFELLRTAGPKEATAAVQRALAGNASSRAASDPAPNFYQPRTEAPINPATPRHSGQHADVNARAKTKAKTPADAQPAEARTPGAFTTHSFSNHAGQRRYKLYVPASYNDEPLPLIVMLHGCTQNADDFAAGTQMNAMAERQRCIVVYPEQVQSANHSKCWNWFKPVDQQRGQGEPSLIEGITREVIARYRVDPARVYIAGLSAGGAMADIMLKTSPDLYAAACVHSGIAHGSAQGLPSALAAMRGGNAHRQRPRNAPQRPLIVFHGDADSTVHPSNASELVADFDASSITASEPPRVGNNANQADAASKPSARRSATVQMLTAANGIEAEYWSIHGAGHAWAGGSQRGSYSDPAGPDATAEMLRFFLAHPKPH
jgi:poly(hydroxyalkanoate) depolymerase family esterase